MAFIEMLIYVQFKKNIYLTLSIRNEKYDKNNLLCFLILYQRYVNMKKVLHCIFHWRIYRNSYFHVNGFEMTYSTVFDM